jgi:hypothetical protein
MTYKTNDGEIEINPPFGTVVKASKGPITVVIEMSDFSRDARRAVYAWEREMYDRYPEEAFTFYLVDKSQESK